MIRVRTIGANSLEHVLGKSSMLGGLFDASPIYTNMRIRVRLTGGMTASGESMTFSVDEQFAFERVQIDGSGNDPELLGMEANGDLDIGVINLDSVGEGQFIMKAEKALNAGLSGAALFSPTNGAFSIYPPASGRTLDSAGTYTLDPDPVVTLAAELSVGSPNFATSALPAANERNIFDRIRIYFSVNITTPSPVEDYLGEFELDISGWDRAKWRDASGVYAVTEAAGTYHPVGWDTSTVQGSVEFEFLPIPTMDFSDPYNTQLIPLI